MPDMWQRLCNWQVDVDIIVAVATIAGASQVALVVKNLPANVGDVRDTGSIPGSRMTPWRRAWQPTSVFLPGESNGQRSLVGYSPWDLEEWNTTEVTEHARVHY